MSARHWVRTILILAALVYLAAVIISGSAFIPAGSIR